MSQFCGLRPGSLLDELNYIKKLALDKKNEKDVWSKFCLKCEDGDDNGEAPKKFTSHPRLCSNGGTSVYSSRPSSVSSKHSVPNMDLTDIDYAFRENKMKIQNARKQLYNNETEPKTNEIYNLELGMGDSCSITPRNQPDGLITYYDGTNEFGGNDGKYKKKNFSNKMMTTSLMANPRRSAYRSPSVQNSNRNVVFVTDSVFEKKFRLFVERSLHVINDIGSLLDNGINPPDGEEDESRRIIRVKEFSNRFSRNCLYPLARQLEKLGEMEQPNLNLNHKLLSAYQVVLNGLQAYYNHLPTSTGSCSSDKLKSLLKHLLQLCDIHLKNIKDPEENVDGDFIKTFKLNAELTLQKIDDCFTARRSSDSVLKSKSSKVNSKQNGGPKTGVAKSRKNSLETRLSMYNIPTCNSRKEQYWRMMQSWAKKRTNVQSRYKTATYRHRPPVEKKQSQPLLSKSKLLPKKSSHILLKRTPITTPVNEDNITTLIQMEEDKEKTNTAAEGDGGKSGDPSAAALHESIVVKLLQLVLDNNRRTNNDKDGEQKDEPGDATAGDDDARIKDILEQLKAGGEIDVLRNLLTKLQRDGGERKAEVEEQLKLQIVKSHSSVGEAGAKKRREPKVTVTGEKNAKLICITDDNSIVETDDTTEPEDKDCSTEKQMPLKPVSSTETQTNVTANKKDKSTQKAKKTDSIQIKRLPKCCRYLQKLPKDYALGVIQYKLDFHRHCKQNPMYGKTSEIQPWMLMAKISDEILDDALLGVAKEIDLNDIVQQVYDSEFQL